MSPPTALIACADDTLRPGIARMLQARGLETVEARTVTRLRMQLGAYAPSVLVLGALDGVASVPQLAEELHRHVRHVPIVALVPIDERERAGGPRASSASLEALAASATAALGRPATAAGRDAVDREEPALLGTSAAIREIDAYIDRVAAARSTVLITGETGTGKELTASLIHRRSVRHRQPFVCVNCAAIPDTLLESELFGFERGAFTGAHAARSGKLQQADGGTIFFDEIGDMSPTAQPKILRALETREIQRVGGRGSVPVDLRVIAATNQELDRKVREGQFREDLFYRLNVARIHLPPLRDRKEDLPSLLDAARRVFNERFGRRVAGFTPEAVAYLFRYAWPGNVRELRNLVEAIYIDQPGELIAAEDLPESFRRHVDETERLPEDERTRVLSALSATNWNKSQAAHRLHWSRMTLYRKIEKYRLGEARPVPQRTSAKRDST
jgi:DNA-binding NtrC family response regulator